MERKELYKRINEAKASLTSTNPDAAKTIKVENQDTHNQYLKATTRIFGFKNGHIILPKNASTIVKRVQEYKTKSTLRKYARSIRYVSLLLLKKQLKNIDKCQRARNWTEVEKIVSNPVFLTLSDLSKLLPKDYQDGWMAERKRKGKKQSISKLPDNFRELIAANSKGRFRFPTLIAIMTGLRPVELENGVDILCDGKSVSVTIKGAKVTETSGQTYRSFTLAKTTTTQLIIKELRLKKMINKPYHLKVDRGNSVTTHIRNIGKKLWPGRKESITMYSLRHAMAADCKNAVKKGHPNPDLPSQVLGHITDKTKSYYGTYSQAKGQSVVPLNVKVATPVKHKNMDRNRTAPRPTQSRKLSV